MLDTDTKRRIGHLADKYRLQMIRYRTILQGLFPELTIEGYLLFVDEPHRTTFRCIT